MPLLLLLIALAALSWLLFTLRPALVAARMFQIEEYERRRFLSWGIGAGWTAHRAVLASAGIGLAALLLAVLTRDDPSRIVAAGWLVASLVGAVVWSWLPPKKPLVYTARMRRLLTVFAVLSGVVAAGVALLLTAGWWIAAAVLVVVPLSFTSRLAQLLLVAADVITAPAESAVRRTYLRRASQRIATLHPFTVAVAGSYGKTSTKHILAALLAPSLRVLPTRRSFNTLMGVTKVINEDLEPSHRAFIVEMDAYGPGEIAAMCRLVHPTLAVVTAVGPQHLERFGTLQRIEDALYETIESLPADGTAVVFAGEAEGAALAARARHDGRSVVTYGIDADGADVIASGVHVDGHGARFTWRFAQRSLEAQVTIPLLGVHQVLNVTAALAVVALMEAPLDAAIAAAAELQPVEHRLQVLRSGGPVTVIDDSYNANPVGVHNGLDVLRVIEGGRKILVTPGLVELGAMEEQENRRYGAHAAAVCDVVIVMEARTTAALRAGLRDGGMAEEHVHLARSLDEATALIARLSRPGDVVLFANDLPDTYLSANRRSGT